MFICRYAYFIQYFTYVVYLQKKAGSIQQEKAYLLPFNKKQTFLPFKVMSSPSQNEENLIAEEGPRVLGIGLGLFFLILLWAFAFVTILSFSRYSSVTSIIILSIASLITITALTLPRYPPFEKAVDEVEPRRLYDTPFIW